jgi:hypothetical protein
MDWNRLLAFVPEDSPAEDASDSSQAPSESAGHPPLLRSSFQTIEYLAQTLWQPDPSPTLVFPPATTPQAFITWQRVESGHAMDIWCPHCQTYLPVIRGFTMSAYVGRTLIPECRHGQYMVDPVDQQVYWIGMASFAQFLEWLDDATWLVQQVPRAAQFPALTWRDWVRQAPAFLTDWARVRSPLTPNPTERRAI